MKSEKATNDHINFTDKNKKMKTLELKDLKYYLGTGLEVIVDHPVYYNTKFKLMSIHSNEKENFSSVSLYLNKNHKTKVYLSKIRPIFLPLSAIIEQLPDGSIPIVELAIMALMYQTDFEVYGFEKQYIDGEFIVAESDMSMRFIFDGKSFWMQNGYGNINVANNQLALFEYLYQNHFWLGDQSMFETGEIIDKRTLK